MHSPDLWGTLNGTLDSRPYLKQQYDEAAEWLERKAEPLTALASQLGLSARAVREQHHLGFAFNVGNDSAPPAGPGPRFAALCVEDAAAVRTARRHLRMLRRRHPRRRGEPRQAGEGGRHAARLRRRAATRAGHQAAARSAPRPALRLERPRLHADPRPSRADRGDPREYHQAAPRRRTRPPGPGDHLGQGRRAALLAVGTPISSRTCRSGPWRRPITFTGRCSRRWAIAASSSRKETPRARAARVRRLRRRDGERRSSGCACTRTAASTSRTSAPGPPLAALNALRDQGDAGDLYNTHLLEAGAVTDAAARGDVRARSKRSPTASPSRTTSVLPRVPVTLRADRAGRSEETAPLRLRFTYTLFAHSPGRARSRWNGVTSTGSIG